LHLSFAGTGTGTPKQTKGHGLLPTDKPSKSALLPEPVGALSSTSLGHNSAREAADGELRFNEAADHLTSTTAMTGQAFAKAVTVQVNFMSAQPVSACLSGSQSVGSFVSMLVNVLPAWHLFACVSGSQTVCSFFSYMYIYAFAM